MQQPNPIPVTPVMDPPLAPAEPQVSEATDSPEIPVTPLEPVIPAAPVKGGGNNVRILMYVCGALVFFVIGILVAMLITSRNNADSTKQQNNNQQILPSVTATVTATVTEEPTGSATPTPTTTVTTTPTDTVTPTNADLPTFTSNELKITFTIPQGVTVREVDTPLNLDGCPGDSPSGSTYKAVQAYINGKQLLFLGINPSCDAGLQEGMEGVTVAYQQTLAGVTYKLLRYSGNPANPADYMDAIIRFGDSSRVVQGKARSNDAIMGGSGTTGVTYTQEEFNKAVTLIASITRI